MKNTNKIDDDLDKNKKSIYPKLSKIFIIISMLILIWIIIIAMGTFIFEMDPNWALLNLETWIITYCIILIIFIILNIFIYFKYSSKIDTQIEFKETETEEYYNGKRLYVYTYPEGAIGGIFSKTHISIDDENILRLRGRIIPPEELWDEN
jgi:hypothetical protein